MTKEFIPYDLALELKELGFDEPCFGYYSEGELILNSHTNNHMQRFRYSAPTFSQAFRWFREKYNLRVSFPYWNGYNGMLPENRRYTYECLIIPENAMSISVRCKDTGSCVFKGYEEAELACLIKLIELCQNKKK